MVDNFNLVWDSYHLAREHGGGRCDCAKGDALAEPMEQPWTISHRADPASVAIADRHYNRQKPGTPQFVPPGRCLVLRTADAPCLWVTSWPFAEYVKHRWPGAWVNSCFRNEAPDRHLSSDLIRAAVAATVAYWPDVPELGMVTFIDRKKTKQKRDPGYCYLMAGFVPDGETKGGLTAVRLSPDAMPAPSAALGAPQRMDLTA